MKTNEKYEERFHELVDGLTEAGMTRPLEAWEKVLILDALQAGWFAKPCLPLSLVIGCDHDGAHDLMDIAAQFLLDNGAIPPEAVH